MPYACGASSKAGFTMDKYSGQTLQAVGWKQFVPILTKTTLVFCVPSLPQLMWKHLLHVG